MLRVPVALLLLALVVPRLPAIPTGTASLHRVPRSQPKSDLEGDTDVLVQDVDQVINKVNKALGDTDDSAETDSDDTAKGLSVKTTEVRISPTQDQEIDESEFEGDDGARKIPEITTNEEEALKTGAKLDEKSVEGISEDALLGAVIQDALENPELLEYFLSKARDAEDALLGGTGEGEVPPAFLSPQKPPVADNVPEVTIVEEQPEAIADSIALDDEKTQEVLEELEADLAAQETAIMDEEDLDEEEMEGANEGDVLDLSMLELLGPQKSVPFPDEVIEEEDDDEEEDLDEEEEDLGVEDGEETDVIVIDDDSDDDEVEALEDGYTDSDDDNEIVDDVTADGELPEDLDDGVF